MPAKETKGQRFERIAERRVNEALRSLRLLGNLSDRRNYDYSEDQVATMLGALDLEYRALRSKFKSEVATGSQQFRFRRGE